MDMESTRRSLDKSREPGAKKPRLIDELDRGSNPTARPFPQPRQPPPPSARFRTNGDRDSESSDAGRVGYYPKPLPPHQELVAQYKTALGELTFNSKPIITNLTIIAGENLSAAKAIAGTICTNIVEVPSEQKLPSLYLLDSIVKNIGRDYIKYFAARLPEVFCKAYRQVDPSLHSSMRHLFGTWKTVFPLQTLQMIEKELGFTPVINGSASASATLRTDSQSQRPAHSIHVNPKYLERQRLQQSSRTKGVVNDLTGAISNSNEDPERPTRVLGASRPWLDPRLNLHSNQRIQRDAFNDSVPEKSVAESFGGTENSSDISSKLGLSMGRTGSRVTELGQDKTWYKAGIDVPETPITGQRNGLSFKLGFSNHEAPKSMNLDAHHQPTQNITNISSIVSNSWKNSEEEEFMWDEMNSGMTGDGAASVPNNLNDPWTGGDDDNLEGEDHHQITHPFGLKVGREISTVRKQPAALGGNSSFSWQLQEQRSIEKLNVKPGHSEGFVSNLGGLSANTNSLVARMGNRSFMPKATTGLAQIIGQQQFDSIGAESTSGQSPLQQQSPSLPVTVRHPHPSQNLAEEDHPQAPKTSQLLGGMQSQYVRDRPPALPPNAQVGNLRRSREKDLQGPLSSVTSIQPRHQQQQLGSSQITVKTKKPSHSKVSLASETSEQSTMSSFSAAAVKSGILPKKSIACSFPSTSGLATRNLSSKSGDRPTRSGGHSSATLLSSGSVAASPSLLVPSNDDSPVPPNVPQGKVGQQPRVSTTQMLASSNVSSAPTSNAIKNNSLDPISNLLSSLVAKGLISAETESSTKVPKEALVGLEKQTESMTVSSSLPVASVSCSAAVPIPVPSSRDEADDAKTSLTLCQPTIAEVRNIIGFDFKPDVIRELHPAVIKELLDDLPHHYGVCGIKLKQEEQLNRHLEWHSTRETEQNGLTAASRKWYANSDDWIAGKAHFPSELSDSVDVYGEETDRSQLDTMVLADENQCLCVLCGELFEDVYCEERDEWMFGRTVFLNNSDDIGEMESRNVGPILHAKCLSENSLSSATKMEQD